MFSPADLARLMAPALAATAACARLDARVEASPWRSAWLARARIHGMARVAELGGGGITAPEFFRGLVGLVDPAAWPNYDWRRLSVSIELVRGLEAAGSVRQPVTDLIDRLTARGGCFLGPEWLDELDAYRQAALSIELTPTPAPSPALLQLAAAIHAVLVAPAEPWATTSAVDHVYRQTGVWLEPPWRGWLLAPRLPAVLAAAGVTATPLPLLVPLRRSMRYSTLSPVATAAAFLDELTAQAAHGLQLVDRLEACAAAWARRLPPTTARSRLEAAAGLFLVLPALTRQQVADALGVSTPGAGKLLALLEAAGIVRHHRLSERRIFHVADESLGDFKLAPRQGRHRAPPTVAEAPPPVLDELAQAIGAVDRLIGAPPPLDED